MSEITCNRLGGGIPICDPAFEIDKANAKRNALTKVLEDFQLDRRHPRGLLPNQSAGKWKT
jgi:hypothetical protein